uniref:Rx N-terminal domain-containing protein n=1 Tax=Fagus sylvatica TaxID=28930 RepID=A0A2N9EI29_FAGSY
MAEGALFDVANGIIGKLGNRALQEILLIWGVKDEIRKFTETVSTIRAVLLDAEAKQHNNEVKVWLERLKDAMFDADDLLDDISTEALRREVMTRNNNKAKEVRIFFSTSNQLAYGLKMGHKVKAMRKRLDAIAVDRKFRLEERSEERQVRFKAREQTYSVVRADDVIGREDDKKAIIGSLLNPNVKEDVLILPIVGIGGLGKTTLAQLVFNDEEIKKHFEQKLWVCVSQDFDEKIIVEKILECATKKKPAENLQMNTLANDLQKEVNGKRYLIVLDDVWNDDGEKWCNLQNLLMGGARGKLPRDINKLVKLKHLEIGGGSLTHMPCGLGQLTDLHTLSLFVVGSVARINGGLKELHELNKLSGNLSIVNLRHGKDAALECKVANLKAKQRLDGLRLYWIREDIDEAGVGYDEMSLEALQPQPNLKALLLMDYGGVRFPSWVLSLTNLVKFDLYSCNKCQHLPPLDHFSSLKSLTLESLDSIEYIDKSEEGLSDSSFLPSLKKLEIEHCPNLKGWWRGRRDSVEEIGITTPITSKPLNYSFPRLLELEIWNCPQLTYMPLFPYLEKLTLWKCSLKALEQTMRMGMINKTPSPSISSSSILSFAPLSKLNYMSIDDMDEALPKELLRNLISLRTLYLRECPLPPQGMQYLTALQHLYVSRSEVECDEMEWQGLRSLLSLEFCALPKLVSLPVGLQHLTSLQTLRFQCPELTLLPEWIGGLTSLQTLEIRWCPILSERCKREIGEDWSKIAKIPNLKGDLSPPEEEEEDSDKKKAALKNRNLIKSFGCYNCSTTGNLAYHGVPK